MRPRREPWSGRREAGRELGAAVRDALAERTHPPPGTPLILALPRGGVVIAAEVADVTGGELDILVVRKAGVPWHRELAIGAVTSSGVRVSNSDVIARARMSDDDVEAAFTKAEREAREREADLRRGVPGADVGGRTVVIVDDGLATGATALAAAQLLQRATPAPDRVLLAAPVAPPDTVIRLSRHVDDVVVLAQPPMFAAVGEWYEDFTQVEDDHVRELLARHRGGTSNSR